jgi:hypothetical protein
MTIFIAAVDTQSFHPSLSIGLHTRPAFACAESWDELMELIRGYRFDYVYEFYVGSLDFANRWRWRRNQWEEWPLD